LLILAAILYLRDLTISGYANEFYAASVKSSTQSWRAWLWASLDSQLSITVDKPPAAIWVMGLSARIFGFSSFSMLLPNALMGIGTVALTYGAVRRLSGHVAGLLAGALVALTPVAALIFRFNNPDSLLVLCVSAAAYMVVRALQTDTRALAAWWLVGAGWLIGLAFLTKMLQGLLVLPAFVLVYILCSRWGWWARIRHLLAAAVSMVVSAGWLIALCALVPASSRPYIGGSENNSLWELAIGYNGLGRVLGGSGNGGGGGGGGQSNVGFGGEPGLLRMFNSTFATEISWLLPAAILLLVTGLAACGNRPSNDSKRAGIILWGTSMAVTALVFSFMQGTIHPYYAVALAPLIAGTIGSSCAALWAEQEDSRTTAVFKRICLAVAVALTGVWGFYLFGMYAAGWNGWIRWVALVGGIAGALVFMIAGLNRGVNARTLTGRIAIAALIFGLASALLPTASWTIATANTAHSGSIPTSGPAGVQGNGMGGPGDQMGDGPGGGGNGAGEAPGDVGSGPGGAYEGTDGMTASEQGARGRGGSGSGEASTNSALVKLLNATHSRWSAAVVGDQSAAGYILGTDTAVFAIGGWSGSDDNVSLAQFKQYVADGDITYFIADGMGDGQRAGFSASGSSSQSNGADSSEGADGAIGSANNAGGMPDGGMPGGGMPGGGTAAQGPGDAPGGTMGSESGNANGGGSGGNSGTGAGSGEAPNAMGETAGGGMRGGFGGASGVASQITSWVASTFTSKTVGGVTVYDLTSSRS
jgi:4-amino-4-deoxy-L-arabinose transferase-like glycosyltransferase